MKAEGRDYWTAFAHVAPTITASIQRSLTWAQGGWAAWNEIVEAPTDEAKAMLLRDPAWRARAREQVDGGQVYSQTPFAHPHQLMLVASENGHGPINLSAKDYGEQTGQHYSDAMADWFLNNGLDSTIHLDAWHNHEPSVVELFKDPYAVGNINDTGAHGQMFCGVGQNMLVFTDYVKRGDLTLEEGVHAITGKPARHFGMGDRGEIKVGKRADIAVFNLDEISVAEWERIYDVPGGEEGKIWRWTRPAAPTRITIVNGVATFENGEPTGERPGQFVAPSQEEKILEAAE
jgi:N-acyl-D-aspartate/D-glutamate deacylase